MFARTYDSISEAPLRPPRGTEDPAVECRSVGRVTFSLIIAVVFVTIFIIPRRSGIFIGRRHVRYAAQHTLHQPQPPDSEIEIPKITAVCAYQGRRPKAQDHADSGHVRSARVYPRRSIFDIEINACAEGKERHDQDGDVYLSELGKIHCQTCRVTRPRLPMPSFCFCCF